MSTPRSRDQEAGRARRPVSRDPAHVGRSFTSHADLNGQLGVWLTGANQRHHRHLGARPVDRSKADHAAMRTLPPVALGSGWTTNLRLPRDHYIRLDGNDYSVDPAAAGRQVLIAADLEQVVVTLAASRGGVRVARHARCWVRHQTITNTADDQVGCERSIGSSRPTPVA